MDETSQVAANEGGGVLHWILRGVGSGLSAKNMKIVIMFGLWTNLDTSLAFYIVPECYPIFRFDASCEMPSKSYLIVWAIALGK